MSTGIQDTIVDLESCNHNASYFYDIGKGSWSSSLPSRSTLKTYLSYIMTLYEFVPTTGFGGKSFSIWTGTYSNGEYGLITFSPFMGWAKEATTTSPSSSFNRAMIDSL